MYTWLLYRTKTALKESKKKANTSGTVDLYLPVLDEVLLTVQSFYFLSENFWRASLFKLMTSAFQWLRLIYEQDSVTAYHSDFASTLGERAPTKDGNLTGQFFARLMAFWKTLNSMNRNELTLNEWVRNEVRYPRQEVVWNLNFINSGR